MADITETALTDEIANLAAGALEGFPIADVDRIDAASDVLQAAGPALVAAELRRLAAELDAVRAEMRDVDNRNIRSSGLGTGIARLRERADELDPRS